jgi:branched-subunit amino acid ABC-type transport system permease component
VIVGVAQSVATSAPIFDSVPGPQSAAVFVLLLVILLVRPQGLLGEG